MKRVLLILPLLCLLASPVQAAITEVASQRASAGACDGVNDCSVAFPSDVTAGSLLIVGGSAQDSATPTIAISDTVGTTYTIVSCTAIDDGTLFAQPFWAYGVAPSAGANTVLVDPTAVGTITKIRFAIDEFIGQHATPLDVDGGNSTGTSTTAADALTTLTANDLVIGLSAFNASNTVSPGASYTQIGESQTTGAGFNFEFAIVTTAQEYTVDWTNSNIEWVACTAAFKEALATILQSSPPPPVVLQ